MRVSPEAFAVGAGLLLQRAEVVLPVVRLASECEAGLHHLGVHEEAAVMELRDLKAVFAQVAHSMVTHCLSKD